MWYTSAVNTIGELLPELISTVPNETAHITIYGVCSDSRAVSGGEMFFALQGQNTDGHLWIDQAVKRGARAVVHSFPLSHPSPTAVYIRCENPRTMYSKACSRFYDNPSASLHCIGVTGTNGKTTSCWMIFKLLNMLGYRCGIISGYWNGTESDLTVSGSGLSTPEASDLHRMLKGFADAGCTHAVIEITSHALSQRTCRVEDLVLSRCLFTPFGRDHLDFHGDQQKYLLTKLHMSDLAVRDAPITCLSSSIYAEHLGHRPLRTLSFRKGTKQPGCINAELISIHEWLLSDPDRTLSVQLPDVQMFLQENLLLSLACIWDLIPEDQRCIDLSTFECFVPGRGEVLDFPGSRRVVIDYAHNPLGFQTAVASFSRPSGKMIALFGAAGSRDTGKRPMMASIADSHADMIIITEEDPFGEDPRQIFLDLLSGITGKIPGKSLFVFSRREAAAAYAMSRMNPGDTLLMLGKGHETVLRSRDGIRHCSDRRTVLRIADHEKWV